MGPVQEQRSRITAIPHCLNPVDVTIQWITQLILIALIQWIVTLIRCIAPSNFWTTDARNVILYNYPPKGRWIVVDIYRDAKRQSIYPPLFTDPEGDSCFSIYQIRWIKKRFFNFFFWNFRETTCHFSLRSQNSEYPRIFQITGANQNARKLLSTDLVNTKNVYASVWDCGLARLPRSKQLGWKSFSHLNTTALFPRRT